MKVGEIYTYGSKIIKIYYKIIKVYYDYYNERISIKVNRLELTSNNRIIISVECTGMELLESNKNLKRASRKEWYKLIRRLNESG